MIIQEFLENQRKAFDVRIVKRFFFGAPTRIIDGPCQSTGDGNTKARN